MKKIMESTNTTTNATTENSITTTITTITSSASVSSSSATSSTIVLKRKERNFPELQLNEQSNFQNSTDNNTHPVLVIQSPKTPTLSRKQKAASLDSDQGQKKNLDVSRDVSSVPNTPKKQQKLPQQTSESCSNSNEFDNDCISRDFTQKLMLTPLLGSNLKRFASNTSISGSQTLKTLPEVMTLQEFTGTRTEPVRIKAKGLLERRGSNASLTIDLGSNSNISEQKTPIRPTMKLNTAKSVSNLNLTSFGVEKCMCLHKCPTLASKHDETSQRIPENGSFHKKLGHGASEKCQNCVIYESIPSKNPSIQAPKKHEFCKCNLKFLPRYYVERHCVCHIKYRRKSLSNENLYVPPCNFCHFGSKDCHLNSRGCNKGSRKALYPRQTYIETSQLLSEDFKLHLQNVQYLQTAGSVLSVAELKTCCQMEKIPRLHQEFWEVPLNLQEKCLVSGSQSRNRYKGVLPNEHSRVHLPGPQSYIHANYIKGPDYTETAYIATQGPMSHTCEDFWNMVWNNKVNRIVMLTALVERGRSKCELYFPLGEQGEARNALFSDGISTHGLIESSATGTTSNDRLFHTQFSYDDESSLIELEQTDVQEWGPYTVRFLSKDQLGECIIRRLELSCKINDKNTTTSPAVDEKRAITHYWYPNWADHKLANPEQVLKIALHVLDIHPGAGGGGGGSAGGSINSATTTDSSSSADAIPNSSSTSSSDPPHETRFKFDNITPLDQTITTATGTAHAHKRPLVTKFPFDSNPLADGKCSLGMLCQTETSTSFESTLKDNNNKLFSFNLKQQQQQHHHHHQQQQQQFDASVVSKLSGGTTTTTTMENLVRHPIVVHCSAGIGRTGCFLAILNGIHQLRSNYNVDILAIVCSLRLNRGGMVQTAEQYELIHRVLSLYADLI